MQDGARRAVEQHMQKLAMRRRLWQAPRRLMVKAALIILHPISIVPLVPSLARSNVVVGFTKALRYSQVSSACVDALHA